MAILLDETAEFEDDDGSIEKVKGITMLFREDEVYLENVDGIPHYAVFMEDEVADEFVQMARNKLNERIL